MVPKRSELASTFACHYGTEWIGAAVAAAAAAASAAQQAAAEAKRRRAAATAEQQAKQGMPGNATPPGSVAESLMGQVGPALNQNAGRIQDMFSPAKQIAGATASAPVMQPLPDLPIQQSISYEDLMRQQGAGGY